MYRRGPPSPVLSVIIKGDCQLDPFLPSFSNFVLTIYSISFYLGRGYSYDLQGYSSRDCQHHLVALWASFQQKDRRWIHQIQGKVPLTRYPTGLVKLDWTKIRWKMVSDAGLFPRYRNRSLTTVSLVKLDRSLPSKSQGLGDG